jgi:hypothetical protein
MLCRSPENLWSALRLVVSGTIDISQGHGEEWIVEMLHKTWAYCRVFAKHYLHPPLIFRSALTSVPTPVFTLSPFPQPSCSTPPPLQLFIALRLPVSP